MKNKYFIIFLILLFCFTITGCSGPTKYQKNIYDNDKLISSDSDSYYSTNITDDNNKIEFSNFTGSYTIWKENFNETFTIDFSIQNYIEKGKNKIVLIKDNAIYKVITNIEEFDYNLEPGHYIIKIVGLNAEGSIKYNVKIK